MGKTKKRYLVNRILAMMLAVAMSVTMIPSTALAAPADDSGLNVAADTNGDGNTPGDADASNNTGEAVSDGGEANDAAPADKNASEGAADAAAGENGGADDAVTGDAAAGTDHTAPDGDAEVKADGDTPAAQPVYEISLGDMETEKVYNGSEPFDISRASVIKKENGQSAEVSESLTATWKVKGADGNFTALEGVPKNAGSYELTLTCAAVEGVHDALTKTVACEIKKAPLVITAKATAKPGDKAVKESVTVEVDSIEAVPADQGVLTKDVITLEVTGIRDAFDSPLKAEDDLKKNGDYVADVKPGIKADASAEAKATANNYVIPESFPANIVMADLIRTRIVVTLADKWKEAGAVTLHVYDGKAAAVPALTTDYTFEVQCEDETAPTGWKKLDNAEVVGSWQAYGGKTKEDGTIEAPVNADSYEYYFTYKGDGKYDASKSDSIAVVIDPAPVTVEIKNTTKITVPAGTSMVKALSQVDYKANAKDRDNKDVVIDAEKQHIWGTGYNDKNVSCVYKPAFTLQIKKGSAWENIDDADYKLLSGEAYQYRVIYDGKKAIYNADGTYAHRTGINSGLDGNGEEINGMDRNYITDETPTADDKALTVEVQPGVEMDWNLEELLQDKAGETPEEAGQKAKEFDNTPLYAKRADYKNKIKLKGVTETGKSFNATGTDFTYKWSKSTVEDLVDKAVMDQNKENGFSTESFEDEDNWWTVEDITAPTDAGIYKLEITYQDNTDDGTLYYLKEDKPAVVYYVIKKVELAITPEGTYETRSGRTPEEFFDENEITYKMLDKDGKEYAAPNGVKLEPYWGVAELKKKEGSEEFEWNRDLESYDSMEAGPDKRYQIEVWGVDYAPDSNVENWDCFVNYTTAHAEKVEEDAVNTAGETKKKAERKETLLGGTVGLTVNEGVALKLTANQTPVAYEKTYDGKAVTIEAVHPETAYTLTKTENGQDVPAEDPGVRYLCVNKETASDESMLEDLSQAGEYDLYACFWGDGTYMPLDLGENPNNDPGVLIGTVTIKKCPITLALDVDDTYEAGRLSSSNVMDDIMSSCKVTGYVVNDECDDTWNFTYNEEDGFPAWSDGPVFSVYEKGSKTPLDSWDILHRDKDFEIRYDADNSSLNWRDGYDRNYEVQNAAGILDSFQTVAAPARIVSTSLSGVNDFVIDREIKRGTGGIEQTVTVLEGIEYATYDQGGIKMTGNLAAFTIYAPAEFGGRIPDTAMYKNAVEGADGKVVSEYKSSGYFTVLFDAAAGEQTFSIRWEDKYVETIKLAFQKEQCLGNLQDAVAPKSLAFNAAPKKLAVGSSVQLDVKITKAQMGDVICLGYRSSDDTILHVNPDTGYVTALKNDKATITVYPKHMDKDGNMVEIKGAKTATVTITGTSVTAPKPVKVTAHDTVAFVDYSKMTDGYRREIYVVDNKAKPSLKKAKDIEDEVKKLQGNKNQWRGTFAIAPIYLDSADETYSRTYWKYTARLSGLQTDTPYTVYVRNVCEAKTLTDGFVITQETVDAGAAGTAVSFKSLKAELSYLDLKLDEKVDGIEELTGSFGERVYKLEYSKLTKGIESKTFGQFYVNAKDDPAAESGDTIVLELPLKEKKDVYQDPKLEYYVVAKDKDGNLGKAQKNELVSVDKKGKIKLTGVGGWYNPDEGEGDCVRVYVRDTVTGEYAQIHLWIVADVDSVTAKKKTMNLTVGQEVELNDNALYTYKVGKSKLTGFNYPDMDMDAVRTAVKAKKEYFELEGTTLRAIKDGGTLELSLTDKTVAKKAKTAADATAKITFVSKELAPVKKIKGFDITNDKFGLTFTSAGYPNAFRVEIADSSKNKILDKRFDLYSDANELWQVSGGRNRRVKDAYVIYADTIRNAVLAGGGKLSKESQYTVTVTAMYNGVAAKPGTGKVKTTKIPAQDWYLEDEYEWDDNDSGKVVRVIKPRGGMGIQVSEGRTRLYLERDEDGDITSSKTSLRVLSGNSYTLTAEPSNRGRVNDTLVWTVSDSKVASVKAAAGAYCITLKGLKPGSTVLEVKSKILGNKVIARYDITVVAVGDAYKNKDVDSVIRYYGDDEPENWSNPTNPGGIGSKAPDYLPLSLNDPRKVAAASSGYAYFSFTAPETAVYEIESIGASGSFYQKTYKGTQDSGWNRFVGTWGGSLSWLTEGETVYLRSQKSQNAYYVEMSQTQRMEPVTVGATAVVGQGRQEYFTFKAPESGRYQFTLSYGDNRKEYLYLYHSAEDAKNNTNFVDDGNTVESAVSKDGGVWLSAYLNGKTEYTLEAKKISEDVAVGTPKQVTLAAGETKYLMYTVAKDGYYQFSSADADADVATELTAGSNNAGSFSGGFSKKLELQQEDSVCLKLTNNGSGSAAFTVAATDITPADLSTVTGNVNIPVGSNTLYQFTAADAGAYRFTMTVPQANAVDAALKVWRSISDAENGSGELAAGAPGTPADGKVTITADVILEAGQTVYMNPINNTAGALPVGVAGAKDTGVSEITTAGASIALTASQAKKALFTAKDTGIYTFATGALEQEVTFEIARGGRSETITVSSGDRLAKKLLLKAGQAVMWTMRASVDTNFSLAAGLEQRIGELKLGQSAQASVVGEDSESGRQATAAGFVFTAPKAGTYTFWSEGSVDTFGILYDIASVDADTCLLNNGNNTDGCLESDDDKGPSMQFAIIGYSLSKGQTVYLKSMYHSSYSDESGSFTVQVAEGSLSFDD